MFKEKYGGRTWYANRIQIPQDQIDRYDFLTNRRMELSDETTIQQAPYAKTWHEKAMKDMIAEAVVNGYDRVAWVAGEEQAERYNLKDVVDYIKYRKEDGDYQVSIFTKDQGHFKTIVTKDPKEIEDTLGKEVTKKIMEQIETEPENYWHNMYNQDIPIGGEGMKAFMTLYFLSGRVNMSRDMDPSWRSQD